MLLGCKLVDLNLKKVKINTENRIEIKNSYEQISSFSSVRKEGIPASRFLSDFLNCCHKICMVSFNSLGGFHPP